MLTEKSRCDMVMLSKNTFTSSLHNTHLMFLNGTQEPFLTFFNLFGYLGHFFVATRDTKSLNFFPSQPPLSFCSSQYKQSGIDHFAAP